MSDIAAASDRSSIQARILYRRIPFPSASACRSRVANGRILSSLNSPPPSHGPASQTGLILETVRFAKRRQARGTSPPVLASNWLAAPDTLNRRRHTGIIRSTLVVPMVRVAPSSLEQAVGLRSMKTILRLQALHHSETWVPMRPVIAIAWS
jgi:hypothetical protein